MHIHDAATRVIDALDASNIEYMLAGLLSCMYYGVSRSTTDADFVVQAELAKIVHLFRDVDPPFKTDPQVSFETVTNTRRIVLKIEGSKLKIELFQLSDDPHDQQRFERRVAIPIYDRQVPFPTVEDVIVTKLRWGREKDFQDIAYVIEVQQDAIDWNYVEMWCDRHGSRSLLDEIRASIPPG